MKLAQHFFNQSGVIRNERLRPNRVISRDFSFNHCKANGTIESVLKRKHFDINTEQLLFLDKHWTLFSSCGFLQSPEGNWILESFSFPYESEFNSFFEQQKPATHSVHLSGIYFVFSNVGFSNYYHVLTELLPRLEFFMPFKGKVKLLVSEQIPSYLAEAFNLLGISKRDYHTIREGFAYTADTFITIPWGLNFIPERFEFLNKELNHPTIKINSVNSSKKRLFVSRKNESFRTIENEEELLPILLANGFQIIDSQNLSLSEQIQLFSKAELICGPHGAGLSNLLWMNKATVLEIRPENFANDCFLHLALTAGATSYSVLETPSREQEMTMNVNPDHFQSVLNLMV